MESIRSLPIEDRPREKLLGKGAHSLTDAELLAIFLRTGIKGKSAIQLARDIIKHFGSLKKLFAADLKSFSQIKGLGVAKYAQLQACIEMSERHLFEEVRQGDVMHNASQVRDYIHSRLMSRPNEVFAVLFVDNQHKVIAFEELFFGSINSTSVHPRVIIQRALRLIKASQPMTVPVLSGLCKVN